MNLRRTCYEAMHDIITTLVRYDVHKAHDIAEPYRKSLQSMPILDNTYDGNLLILTLYWSWIPALCFDEVCANKAIEKLSLKRGRLSFNMLEEMAQAQDIEEPPNPEQQKTIEEMMCHRWDVQHYLRRSAMGLLEQSTRALIIGLTEPSKRMQAWVHRPMMLDNAIFLANTYNFTIMSRLGSLCELGSNHIIQNNKRYTKEKLHTRLESTVEENEAKECAK